MGGKPVAILLECNYRRRFWLSRNYKRFVDRWHTAEKCGVAIIVEITKVMPKGTLDKIVVITAGIGFIEDENWIFKTLP